MHPIIHVIHSMLAAVVTGEILGILERHPIPIISLVGGMIGHFI